MAKRESDLPGRKSFGDRSTRLFDGPWGPMHCKVVELLTV